MNADKLRKKNLEELEEILEKSRAKSEETVEKLLQGKEKDTSKLKKMRREIARVKTVMNEIEKEQNNG